MWNISKYYQSNQKAVFDTSFSKQTTVLPLLIMNLSSLFFKSVFSWAYQSKASYQRKKSSSNSLYQLWYECDYWNWSKHWVVSNFGSWRQSHYIEVAQGGVSSRAIQNWLWIFSLLFAIFFNTRDIMQLISSDATMFLKKF